MSTFITMKKMLDLCGPALVRWLFVQSLGRLQNLGLNYWLGRTNRSTGLSGTAFASTWFEHV